MKRILITGAGGTPSTNFVRSLRESGEPFHLVGVDCNKYYLRRAECDETYLVPPADSADYIAILRSIMRESGSELIYSQPDQEIFKISQFRADLPVKTFLPAHETIEICQNKYRSYQRWAEAGLRVPATMMIHTPDDLERAFNEFGSPVWLRAVISPGGGKGSFRAETLKVGRAWIDFSEGWGRFTAAECLRPDSITWTSLWRNGELIVAQGRRRLYWEFGDRTPSGITGLTGTGVTVSDPVVDDIALKAIDAVDRTPNGIFAVDLTYDARGTPNPTEINIGRFFTTHLFFTRAGLNLPLLFVKLAFDEDVPPLPRKINPLPEGLAWVRGLDFLPILTTLDEIERPAEELGRRRDHLPRGRHA